MTLQTYQGKTMTDSLAAKIEELENTPFIQNAIKRAAITGDRVAKVKKALDEGIIKDDYIITKRYGTIIQLFQKVERLPNESDSTLANRCHRIIQRNRKKDVCADFSIWNKESLASTNCYHLHYLTET